MDGTPQSSGELTETISGSVSVGVFFLLFAEAVAADAAMMLAARTRANTVAIMFFLFS